MAKYEKEIEKLRQEIIDLKSELRKKEQELRELQDEDSQNPYTTGLSALETAKYSRQMLIPSIGVQGQMALKNSKVLIVGAGGLGCPAALYLAGAGVGEIALIDNDVVDVTNLHRQVLHSECDVGVPKVHSAFDTLTSLNTSIKIIPLYIHADGSTLSALLKKEKYDVVIDGTDNVPTRYLLNDLCVMNKIPLVSGSALQMEGQLTVYNYKDGPCYRCLFPVPPPPNTVTSCGDGGVLGVVPGVIGVLEALETIKIISDSPRILTGRWLIFDGEECTFKNVKLRNKNANCAVCGSRPSILAPIDYEQFCGAKAHDKVINIDILKDHESINVLGISQTKKDLIVDVRPLLEFNMCHLPNSVSIPLSDIEKGKTLEQIKHFIEEKSSDEIKSVYVICRRGNDSQRAISQLKSAFCEAPVNFVNVRGGLRAYSRLVDSNFPVY